MRKEKCIWLFLLCIFVLFHPKDVYANQDEYSRRYEQMEENTMLEDMLNKVDFSDIDTWLNRENENKKMGISFSQLVEQLLEDGILNLDYEEIVVWVKEIFLGEIETSRKFLVEIVLLTVVFSILKNFAGGFSSSYVSELCFLMVYCVLAVMLLQSFLALRGIVSNVLTESIDFMRTFIPTFCITMVFSAGSSSAAVFYQMSFVVIYLIEWMFLKLLMPMIQMYVVLEVFNHFFEDEKFDNMTELLRGLVCWGMKAAGLVVLGMNFVQALLGPAKDRLLNGTVGKVATSIPGIGNAMNGITELLLSSGIVIKNSVGVAALLILVVIAAIPMIKIGCMTLFYKLAAAITEPVADKRIVGSLKGMAWGGVLYLKLMGYCVTLFFLTIALTTTLTTAFVS